MCLQSEVRYMSLTVQRIQGLVEEKGTTVRELAEIAGCSKSAMQRYISGERDIPTNIINGIAAAFNVHPAYLFGWVDDRYYVVDTTKQPAQGELSMKKRNFIKLVEGMTDDQLEKLEQILALVENTKL